MKKLIGLFLVLTLVVTLGACKKTGTGGGAANNKVLVVGYDPFSGKFSPFFATTAYDQDVVTMTSLGLMTTDRDGGIVFNSIEGQDITRGANTYHYTGITDLSVNYDKNSDKTTYDIKLKQGVKFSDGVEMTADDIIFSYYVLLDPNYTGSTTLSSVKIVGLQNYLKNSSLAEGSAAIQQDLLSKIGTANANATLEQFVKDQISALLTSEFQWVKDDVVTNAADWSSYWKKADGTPVGEGETPSAAGTFVGFYAPDKTYRAGTKDDATVLADVIAQYGVNYALLDKNYGSTDITDAVTAKAFDLAFEMYKQEVGNNGSTVTNVSGITKVNQYEVKVVTYGFDAAAIYQVCGITVAPLHYYGDVTKYDYANNKFGFDTRTEGNMTLINSKTAQPLGAGPYIFKEFKENVVYFEANPNYYKGEPKIKYINFQVVTEANKITAIQNGEIDVSNPSGTKQKFQQLNELKNSIYVSAIDNLGYGYIGMNAYNVSVGDPGSDASKDLRKGFATVLSALRYTEINTYYGEAAKVINYPISNTSWAAPKAGEAGYKVAYSTLPNGSSAYGTTTDIPNMPMDQREAAAKLAAKAWLEAAGYTFTATTATAKFGDKVYTAVAPTGAKTNYEVIIPGGGEGAHPSFGIVTEFKNIMAELGITIEINDPADSNVLWNALDAGTQEMWCAAWGATIDPDMYQIYYSGNVVSAFPNSLANTTGSNHYAIQSAALDKLIVDARKSDDQAARKTMYKQAFDTILDWGVEVPIYQRQNIIAISSERVDISTLTPEITTYWGWMNDIENIQMK